MPLKHAVMGAALAAPVAPTTSASAAPVAPFAWMGNWTLSSVRVPSLAF